MNSETLRAKVYLLVLDKIVIGAIIAVALLVYRGWEREKLEAFERERDEFQATFERAANVKELLPLVVEKGNPATRASGLIALVETESVTDAQAVFLAHELFYDDGVPFLPPDKYFFFASAGNLSSYPLYSREHPLLSALLRRRTVFPVALAVQQQSVKYLDSLQQGDEEATNLVQAVGFWSSLLREFVLECAAGRMHEAGDEMALDGHIFALDGALPGVSRDEYLEWVRCQNRSIQLIGSLRVATSGLDDANAVQLIARTIRPDADLAQLRLAADVLLLLQQRAVSASMTPSMEGELLATLVSLPKHKWDELSPSPERAAAKKYLDSLEALAVRYSCAHPDFVSAVEDQVVSELERFIAALNAAEPSEILYNDGMKYVAQTVLVRILLPDCRSLSFVAERSVLQRLFDLPQEKLNRIGLHELAERWRAGSAG